MIRKTLFRTFAVDVKSIAVGERGRLNSKYRKDSWGLKAKEHREGSVDVKL